LAGRARAHERSASTFWSAACQAKLARAVASHTATWCQVAAARAVAVAAAAEAAARSSAWQSGARDLKQQRTRAAIVRNTTTRKGTERRDRMERRWGQQELTLLRCVPPIAGSAAKREIWSSRASKSWARARRREPAWASSGAAAWSGAADSESPNPGLAQQHAVPRRCARLNHSVINDSSCYNALRCAPTRCAACALRTDALCASALHLNRAATA
jgi:hypothetical protein